MLDVSFDKTNRGNRRATLTVDGMEIGAVCEVGGHWIVNKSSASPHETIESACAFLVLHGRAQPYVVEGKCDILMCLQPKRHNKASIKMRGENTGKKAGADAPWRPGVV